MKDSFKELTFKELVQKREDLKKQYFDLRFKMVVGHVDNPLEKRNLRRKIARLNCLIYNHPDVVGGSSAVAAK
jgi:large subunit ribosomal protein L29